MCTVVSNLKAGVSTGFQQKQSCERLLNKYVFIFENVQSNLQTVIIEMISKCFTINRHQGDQREKEIQEFQK